MRLKLIGCEVLYREICAVIARSPNQVDAEFLPKGLHEGGAAAMRSRLQQALDRVDARRYQAVLFGYGLCKAGLIGLRARGLPIVVPRMHDCIGLLFGGRERYLDYCRRHPHTFFRSVGWVERGNGEVRQLAPSASARPASSVDPARSAAAPQVMEVGPAPPVAYERLTYIEMGLEPDQRFERQARTEAEQHGWRFEKAWGDLVLLQHLVDGYWNHTEFLVVPSGGQVAAQPGEELITLAPAQGLRAAD